MRPDMHKVIVERERKKAFDFDRYGKRSKREQSYARDPESAPKKEPLRPVDQRQKSLNENLRPLVKFLVRQVGRPWDKVFSEIREHLSPRTAVKKHVTDHVWDVVFRNVVVVDGVPCRYPKSYEKLHSHLYGDDALKPITTDRSGSFPALYVCPDSGILKRAKMPRAKKTEPPPFGKRVSEGSVAVFWRGRWHLAETAFTDAYIAPPRVYIRDAVLSQVDNVYGLDKLEALYGKCRGRHQYARTVRPMKREEVRMLPFDVEAAEKKAKTPETRKSKKEE